MAIIEPYEGKPDIKRLVAATLGEPTDRVPNLEVLIEENHVEKLLGRKAGNTLAIGGNPAKSDMADKEGIDFRPMHAKDYIEICQIIGQDAILVEQTWTPLKQRDSDGSIVPLAHRSVKSKKDMEKLIWPDETDMEERLQYIREYVEATKNTDIGVIFGGGSIYQYLYEIAIGFEDAMILIMEDPEFFDELMSRSADYFSELVSHTLSEGGVDIFCFGDDFAYNSGLFVRPDKFEAMWRPHYDQILEPVRNAGKPIWFHSCGKIDDAVDMLLDMGVNCITPMDPGAVDYRDYKKRYGHRVTLWGNISTTGVLHTGTPKEVDADVKEHMDVLKPGGRWIAASSHSIGTHIPHENFISMINAFHKYGSY